MNAGHPAYWVQRGVQIRTDSTLRVYVRWSERPVSGHLTGLIPRSTTTPPNDSLLSAEAYGGLIVSVRQVPYYCLTCVSTPAVPGVRIIVALFLHDMRQHASKTGGTADSMFASIVTGEVPRCPHVAWVSQL